MFYSAAEVLPLFFGYVFMVVYTGFGIYTPVQQLLWLLAFNNMHVYSRWIDKYIPAIHAVIKHATFPAIIALRTIAARSAFRCGAMAPNAPSIIPIEPRLEKPHNAYVEMTSDLSWKILKQNSRIEWIEGYELFKVNYSSSLIELSQFATFRIFFF